MLSALAKARSDWASPPRDLDLEDREEPPDRELDLAVRLRAESPLSALAFPLEGDFLVLVEVSFQRGT